MRAVQGDVAGAGIWRVADLDTRRLEMIVVDAAPARPLEQRECAVMGIEHHLLRLRGYGAHEQHRGVTEPEWAAFTVNVTPFSRTISWLRVELIGFRREA